MASVFSSRGTGHVEREQERKEKDSNSSVLEMSVLYETVKSVTACVVVCVYIFVCEYLYHLGYLADLYCMYSN